jgi:CRISPR-associated protein Cas1
MFLHESTNIKIKFVQYHAYEDEDARVKIARNLIEVRFDKSKVAIDYLKQRYPSSQKGTVQVLYLSATMHNST